MFNLNDIEFLKPSLPCNTFSEDTTTLSFDSPKFDFRDAFTIFYLPLDCPLGRKCPMSLCPLSHTTLEKIFHPIIYKTKPCQKSSNGACEYDRKCSFHHGPLDRARSDLLWQKWESKWEGWRETIKSRFREKFPANDPLHSKLDSIMKIRDWKDTFSLPDSYTRGITFPDTISQKSNARNASLYRNYASQIGMDTAHPKFLPELTNTKNNIFSDPFQNNFEPLNPLGIYHADDSSLIGNKKSDLFNKTLDDLRFSGSLENKSNRHPATTTNLLDSLIANKNFGSELNINDPRGIFPDNSHETTTASPSTPLNSSPARSCFSSDPNFFTLPINQAHNPESNSTTPPHVQLPSAVTSLPHLSHQDLCQQCAYLNKMSLMFYKAYIQQLQGCPECHHHLYGDPIYHKQATRPYSNNEVPDQKYDMFNIPSFSRIDQFPDIEKSLNFPDFPQKTPFDINHNQFPDATSFLFPKDL